VFAFWHSRYESADVWVIARMAAGRQE